MQQGEAARHPSGSVGPCRISFHSLNTRARERLRCPFPSGGNGGTEGLGTLPEGSVFCLRDPCSELDASGASLGHTSRLCTDQPRWALTRASVGAHTGIPWRSHGHPLELTRASLGAAFEFRLCLSLVAPRPGPGPWPHPAALGVLPGGGDRGGPDPAGQPSGCAVESKRHLAARLRGR